MSGFGADKCGVCNTYSHQGRACPQLEAGREVCKPFDDFQYDREILKSLELEKKEGWPGYCPICRQPFMGRPPACPEHGPAAVLWAARKQTLDGHLPQLGLMPDFILPAVGADFHTTEALKADGGKNPLELLPFAALEEVALVLQLGAKKYAAHNWLKGMAWSRLLGSALRHIFSWARGEKLDPEFGRPHLAHAACCILFLIEYELAGLGTDDRYTEGKHKEANLE